jgi:NAD(P)-dependent dehydrogenase (short-subunit alcohol dehydrogenase family)
MDSNKVNAVAPGSVVNHQLARAAGGNPARVASTVPMSLPGGAIKIAEAALWLCSDQASFATGYASSFMSGPHKLRASQKI